MTINYTAIIIEPREHPAFKFVFNNFINNLDEAWEFIIFYGTNNKEFMFNLIKNDYREQLDRIRLVNLNVDNLNIIDYNSIFYNKLFYDFINTEYFLIFQIDTLIRSSFKYYIYDFLKYDYVGAPWINPEKIFNRYDCNNVGNGGLSLRKKSKMLNIIDKYYSIKSLRYNEDYFFTRKYVDNNISIPTVDLAKFFSVESIYCEESFGIHKPWSHLNNEDYIKLISNNPEIYELELLNKDYKSINDIPIKEEYENKKIIFTEEINV